MKRIISTIVLILFLAGITAGVGYMSKGFKDFSKDGIRKSWKEISTQLPKGIKK